MGTPAQDDDVTLSEAPDADEALQQVVQGAVADIGGDAAASEDVTYDNPKLMVRGQPYKPPEQEAEHTALWGRVMGNPPGFQKIESAWAQLKQQVAVLHPKMNMDFWFTLSEDEKSLSPMKLSNLQTVNGKP